MATIAHFRDTQPKRPLESVPPNQSTPLDALLEKPIFRMHQRSEKTPREKPIKSKAPLVPPGFEREKRMNRSWDERDETIKALRPFTLQKFLRSLMEQETRMTM